MNKVQAKMYDKIRTPEDLCKYLNEDYDLKDIAIVVGRYIKENGIPENQTIINNCVNYIVNNLVESLYYDSANIDCEYSAMLDSIKHRINQLDKNIEEEQQERKVLKRAYKDINNIITIYSNEDEKEKKDGMADIFMYFASREDGLNYIKEILKNVPDACNVKIDDKHIVIVILEKYIKNFKIMLDNKNNCYLNKDYLFEVYSLFVRNRNFRLSKTEKMEINKMLSSFQFYVQNTLIKEKRKVAALKDVKKVVKELEYYSNSIRKSPNDLYEINEEGLPLESKNIVEAYRDRRSYSEQAIVPEDAFTLNDTSYAYTVSEDDNNYIIKVHVPNIHAYIADDSDLRLYLYNELLIKNNKDLSERYGPDNMFSIYKGKFSLKKDNVYDTITFVLKYNKNGTFDSFDMKKSIIKITDKYFENQDYYWMLHKPLNYEYKFEKMQEMYRKIASKTNHVIKDRSSDEQLNDFIKSELNKAFAKFMCDKKLPFLYYGYHEQHEKIAEEHINNLAQEFSNLSKEQFNKVSSILKSNVDRKHYFTKYNEEFRYDLSLLKSFSFLGIESQKIIDILVFNMRDLDKEALEKVKNKYKNYLNQLSLDLNSNLNYVDQDVLMENKGKIKRRRVSKNYFIRGK